MDSGLHGGALHNQSTTIAGLGDGIFIPGLLNWNFGQFRVSAAFSFYAPTGQYDPTRIISTGLNRWAFEPDVGLTWMDSGREDLVVRRPYRQHQNTADHYQSGQEFHADFGLAQHFANGFLFGMSGYAFQQTTADSGSGALMGPFKGRVIGLGRRLRSTKFRSVSPSNTISNSPNKTGRREMSCSLRLAFTSSSGGGWRLPQLFERRSDQRSHADGDIGRFGVS